jgi:GNAT superfamily N-acetyltransferase
MVFRQAEKKDLNSIVELARLYCPVEYISHSEIIEDFASGPSQWTENWWLKLGSFLDAHFEAHPEYVHVVETELKEIIGYAILDMDQEYDYSKKYGTVHDVLISPHQAGKGLGSAFFDYIQNFFSKNECKFILFESGAENHKAHHFFDKLNYKVISKVFYKEI